MYKKMNRVLGVVIVGVIFLMSMGYSVLNRELNISGELTYRPEGDIRITDVTLASTPENTTLLYSDFSKKQINIGFKSSEASAKIAFTIEVTNFTDTEMGILKIDNLPNIAKIDGYTLKTKLTNSKGSLKAGESTTFTITFNPTVNNTYEYILKFDFEPVCKITYNGFKDTTNFKSEVLYGDTFTQDFGSDAPNKIALSMNNTSITNYSYVNGNLTIPNVDGDIIITVNETPSFKDTSGASAPVLNGDMIPVVYNEYEKEWQKQDLDKSYDYNNQIWANAVTVVNKKFPEKIKDVSGNNNDGDLYNVTIKDGVGYFDTSICDDEETCGMSYIDTKFDNKFEGFTIGLRVKPSEYSGGTIFSMASEGEEFLNLDANAYVDTVSFEFLGIGGNADNFFYLDANAYDIDISDYITIVAIYNGFVLDFYVNGNLCESWDVQDYFDYYDYAYFETSNWQLTLGNVDMEISDFFISNDLLYYAIDYFEEDEIKQSSILYYDFNSVEGLGMSREYYKKAPAGTTIPMDDINTMWVWIPRYSYTIKSEDGGTNYFGKASFGNNNPTNELPGEIDIKFINTSIDDKGNAQYTGSTPTGWRTNDAFDFGGTPTAGIWMSKFGVSGNLKKYEQACVDETCDVSNVTIKPGLELMKDQNISSFFYMSRSMQMNNNDTFGFDKTKGDLHLIKNDEWGAVAYLFQSKYGKYGNSEYTEANKEVYRNNASITGNSSGKPKKILNETNYYYDYNDMTNLAEGQGQAGPGASTTGTIYGIYDMNGHNDIMMAVYACGKNCDDTLDYEHAIPFVGGWSTAFGDGPSESGFLGKKANHHDDEIDDWTYGDYIIGVPLPAKKYYNYYTDSFNETFGSPSEEYPYGHSVSHADKFCNGGICYGQALSETLGNKIYSRADFTDGDKFYGWYNNLYYYYTSDDSPWFVHDSVFGNSFSAGSSSFTARLILTP